MQELEDVYELYRDIREIINYLYIPVLIMGMIQAFFGYKLFRIYNSIIGFFVGALLGAILGILLFPGVAEGAAIVGLVFGILGILLANLLYSLSVFFTSFFTGFLSGVILALISNPSISTILTYGVVCGLIFGIIGVVVAKYAIMIESAANGGILVGTAMIRFWDVSSAIVIGILIGVIGFIVQIYMSRKPKDASLSPSSNENSTLTDATFNANSSVNEAEVCNNNTSQNEDKRLLLKDAFQPDIYREIINVFSNTDSSKLVYMPVFHDDGSWMCTCGKYSANDECIFCGMKKQDALNKINFQYLNNHISDRMQKAEEDKQKKLQEADEKKKQIKETAKKTINKIADSIKVFLTKFIELIKKHKKPLITVLIAIAAISILIFVIVNNKTVRMNYYLSKADNCTNVDEKIVNYKASIDEKDNLKAYLMLIQLYTQLEDYDQAVQYNDYAKELYSNNDDYIAFEQTLIPGDVNIEPEDEVEYESGITIFLSTTDDRYQPSINYRINGNSDITYTDGIDIDTSGEYVIEAYVTNVFGYKGNESTAHYSLNVLVPEDIKANYESGYYYSEMSVELSQPEDETIYYTLDGSVPTDKSLIYNDPIECSYGVTNINAICYNKYGTSSKVLSNTYCVSNGSERIVNYCQFAGYYYDYVYYNDELNILDKKTGEIVSSIPEATNPYEYEGNLYYCNTDGDIRRVNVIDGNFDDFVSLHECGEQIIQMAIIDHTIYYILNSCLYSLNVDGGDNQLITTNICGCALTVESDKLYYCTWDKQVYCIKDGNTELYDKLSYTPEEMAICGKSIYYCDGKQIYKHTQKGDKIICKSEHTENTIPAEGFNGKQVVTFSKEFSDLQISGDTLFYKCYTISKREKYSWLITDDVIDSDKSVSNSWIMFNMKTGDKKEVSTSEMCTISDDCFYENGTTRVKFERKR